MSIIDVPTAPVAPTTATVYPIIYLRHSLFNVLIIPYSAQFLKSLPKIYLSSLILQQAFMYILTQLSREGQDIFQKLLKKCR